MRRDDIEPQRTFFRSSDRVIRLNGNWYFASREGDQGPYNDEMTARRELKRHLAAHQDLKHFQAEREEWSARRAARTAPRKVSGDGLFTLDSIVD